MDVLGTMRRLLGSIASLRLVEGLRFQLTWVVRRSIRDLPNPLPHQSDTVQATSLGVSWQTPADKGFRD